MCNIKRPDEHRTPRNLAPSAPSDAVYPNVPERYHADGCVFDQTTFTCSCGLTASQMADGDFVRYVAVPGSVKIISSLDINAFLSDLREETANVDMSAYNRYA